MNFFGILIIIAGAILGAYLGLWVCFIGGIVQVVESISPVNGFGIAFGILRFCCSALVGWGTFLVMGAIGAVVGLKE